MGSEHYCLRWNNHQSNLLGVFSQLLQNESLVDVTLACSEGAPIRAHKVVLSACSSYFQSLFLDHPERHPIVILKDVRFSELQTLVEFMYKGEVNVQYCQLSALLKTAESLKVKGLAEMTNQNTASREPEREPERLRPHSQPKTCDSPMDGVSSGNNNGNQAQNLNAIASHLNSSSSSASTIHLKRDDRGGGSGGGGAGGGGNASPTSPTLLPITKSSPVSLDYYHRNCPSGSSPRRSPTNNNDGELQIRHHLTSPDHDRPNSAHEGGAGGGNVGGSGSCDDNIQSHDCGINMSLSGGNNSATTSSAQSNTSISLSVVVPSINSSSSSTIPSDLRPSSRSGHDRTNNNGGPSSTITHSSSSGGGLSSPNLKCEPMAGPSGLGPVQSVPLSLKKEIDWDRNDEKSSSDTMDYRHSHDSETSELALGIGASICGSSGGSANNSSSAAAASSSAAVEHGAIYTCMYCGSTFPHQSKLTRHILHTHSLDSLKYREHQSHILSLLPHDLPHFPHRPLDALDPNDHPSATTPMDIDFATAVAAAANFQNVVAAAASSSGVGGNTSLSISTNSSLSGGGVIGSAPSSSTASSAAAAMAACSSGNDPNSVVLCKFCGKSFPDVTSLITHLPVHTGDRPFKCEFCGKAFKLRHHMKDHCRVHTGERPFKCNKCGKTFARSTILKSHEKTHYPRYSRLRQF